MKTTRDQYEARLAARTSPPMLRAWTEEARGAGATVIEFRTMADAIDAARRGTDYMVQGAADAWTTYLRNHEGDKGWNGGVSDAAAWDAVVRDPGAKLRDRITACMGELDALPTPFREQPRRRTVRGLDEGDMLDPVRMQQDNNWERAWTDRIRTSRPRPALRIVLNGGMNCNLTAENLAWRGAVAMAIARKAEDAGADVEVLIALNWERGASDNPGRSVVVSWPVKAHGEHADRDTLTAYCCHLAALRWFAWCHLAQNLMGDTVDYAWGSMRNVAPVAKHLAADIVIDYDVVTKERAMATLRSAAEVIARK